MTPPRLLTPSLLLLLAITFAYFVGVAAMLPVFPLFIKGPLDGTDAEVGVAAGAFGLAAVAVRPFAGRLGDRRGRRTLIVSGTALVGVAVAGYSLAQSLLPLVLLRLLSGAGEALFFTGSATAVNDLAPPARRGEAVSMFSVALYGGLAIGPLAGEALLRAAGFTPVWISAAAVSLAAAVLAVRLPDTRPEGTAESPPGALVHRKGLVTGAVMAASVWGFAGFASFVPLYAPSVGLEGTRFVFALYSGIILAVRFFGARIPDRAGAMRTARVSLGVTTAGLGVIAAVPTLGGLVGGVVVFALGQSLAFPALMSLTVDSVPPAERASVIGTFTAFIDIGFGLGPLTLGAVAEAAGYRGAFAAGSAVAAAGLALLATRVRSGRGGG